MKNFIQNNINLIIIIVSSSVLSIFQVYFRMSYTHTINFSYMLWNLALAWIPLILSLYFLFKHSHKLLSLIIFICWLLFLPNTFYMLTDFVHLRETRQISYWFDLILIFGYVWNGMALGMISLNIVHNFYLKKFQVKFSHLAVITILTLSSFGIYLGRFLRWNSWDILTNPTDIANDIAESFTNPLLLERTYGTTILLTFFLVLIYYAIYVTRTKK